MRLRSRTLTSLTTLLAAAALVVPGAAAAHIQVTPTRVAPNDPVEFQLLVPNERDNATTQVRMQVPPGVLAFSFADVPGWKRTTKPAADGSIGEVMWTGSLAPESFARFSFLASTPDSPGTLSWKALQTYADGTIVKWIGAKGTDEPAAVTTVSADAPHQNAGGEDDEDDAGTPGKADTGGGSTTNTDTSATAAASEDGSDDGAEADWVARGLGIASLALAALVLVLVIRTGRRGGRS